MIRPAVTVFRTFVTEPTRAVHGIYTFTLITSRNDFQSRVFFFFIVSHFEFCFVFVFLRFSLFIIIFYAHPCSHTHILSRTELDAARAYDHFDDGDHDGRSGVYRETVRTTRFHFDVEPPRPRAPRQYLVRRNNYIINK